MSKRTINIFMCLLSLSFGAVLYVIYRENTIIAKIIESFFCFCDIRDELMICSNEIFKFYLPDYLWAFSLCCGLNAIFDSHIRCTVWNGVVSFACGIIWELLQLLGAVSGTGDIIDVILYLSASVSAVMINIKMIRRKR